MKKYLLFPDIHGRTYWKDVLEKVDIDDFEKVIFLGDYVDPYPFENTISVDSAIENFREIIDFKSKNDDKVVLLLGNHDYYYFTKTFGPSRYSVRCHEELEMMFEDDRNFFQIAFETDKTLFTHAGVVAGWLNFCRQLKGAETINPSAETLNTLINETVGKQCLQMVGESRGGRYAKGSCIWADWHEHPHSSSILKEEYNFDKVQVFGHTLQLDTDKYYKTHDVRDIFDGQPVISEDKDFAMLDCRHAFIYNEDNFSFEQI